MFLPASCDRMVGDAAWLPVAAGEEDDRWRARPGEGWASRSLLLHGQSIDWDSIILSCAIL